MSSRRSQRCTRRRRFQRGDRQRDTEGITRNPESIILHSSKQTRRLINPPRTYVEQFYCLREVRVFDVEALSTRYRRPEGRTREVPTIRGGQRAGSVDMTRHEAPDPSASTRGGSSPPLDVCWRCRDTADRLREIDHPDPAIDRRVRVCETGCWLPESTSYRCHECGENHSREQVRLVRSPTRADLVPECLSCNRAVVVGD